jgi:hypothetical protein
MLITKNLDLKFNSTLFKAKQTQFVFASFTTVDWESSNKWKSDANAFLFSLANKDNLPVKMKIKANQYQYAIDCFSEFCPFHRLQFHQIEIYMIAYKFRI